jgi:uncharacterized protein (DUF1778 family)
MRRELPPRIPETAMPRPATQETHAADKTRRDTTINLRLSEKAKGLIDAAAAALGKTRTEFVIESAKQHATDVLLDQRLFELDAGQWNAFMQALGSPPLPNEQLRGLMARKPPWEK